MPDEEGELLLTGSYDQIKAGLIQAKATQQMLKWYGGGNNPVIVQKSGGVKRNDKPWIHLYFLEERPRANSVQDSSTAVVKTRKKEGQISFRLMQFECPRRDKEIALTKEQFIPFGERVKSKFAHPPFVWQKGKKLYSYCEHDKGVQFQLLVPNESEAMRVAEQALDIINASPNWKYLNFCSTVNEGARYPDTTDRVTLLGERIAFPQERPNVSVTFRYALIYFPTVDKTFTLYDRSGKLLNPLVARE